MLNFPWNPDGSETKKRNPPGLGLGLGLIAVVLLCAELAVAGAAEQTQERGAPAPRTDINPALLYWQAFDQRVELSADVRKAIFAEPPTLSLAEAEPHIARYDLMFERLRCAARMRLPCDWGSDPADGPGAYIPNLVTLRKTAQLVPIRVHYALEAGRDQQAVEDAMAVLVLGRHTGQALTLVTTMIGMAIESLALTTVADHFQQLRPDALNSLEAQLNSAPARATVKQAMTKERTLFLDWMIARLEGLRAEQGIDEAKALEEFRTMIQRTLNLDTLGGLDSSGQSLSQVIATFRAARPAYDWAQLVAAAPPDRLSLEHETFQQKVADLKNPLTETLMPNLLKARQTELRLNAHLAMVRAAIALRSGGEEAFRRIRDPFGDGPFILRRLGSGENAPFELDSGLRKTDERGVALKFAGGRPQ